MNELISIIVPVYNVERYLEKCILSIQNQTYTNLEIILIDDGSTDNSSAICDTFAKADARIKVLHKKNGGLVSARKAGLAEAHGFYVANIDSDDWIEAKMLEVLLEKAQEGYQDILCTNHFLDYGSCSKLVKNKLGEGLYSVDAIRSSILNNGVFFEAGIAPYIWSKLIKRAILEKVLPNVDDEISFGEDVATVIPAVLEASTIQIIDYAGYHYVQRQDSIVGKKYIDEEKKDRALIRHLRGVFFHNEYASLLLPQLYQYEKNLLLLRNLEWYDSNSAKNVLLPFGGIPADSRVIIYAAGRFGQNIYGYLQNKGIHIADWFDREFAAFQKLGYLVHNPEEIRYINEEYDYVIISAISEKVAEKIKEDLLDLGVSREKIIWLTDSFISPVNTILTYKLGQLGYRRVILCGFRTYGKQLYAELLGAGIDVVYVLERNYQALREVEESDVPIIDFEYKDMDNAADAILLSGDLNEEEIREILKLSDSTLPVVSLTDICF